MLQCIVTAQKLNIRKVLPERLPDPENIIGVVSAGAELEAEEVDTSELPNQDLGKWYRDRDGKFYWGGGLLVASLSPAVSKRDVEIDFQEFINKNFDGTVLKDTINYNQLLSLNSVYKNTLGDGMTIALLDTGISARPLLEKSLLPTQFCFTKSVHKFEDIEGHGTFLSGLICGYSDRRNTIIGIAPKCKISNIKVLNDDGSAVGSYLQLGLEKVASEYEHCIINMSLNITAIEYRGLISKGIIELLSNKNVCIAAAGENDGLLFNKGIYYPASSDSIIAVGTIDQNFFENNPSPKFDPRLDYIIPQFDLVSIGINSEYKSEPGVSSMACAIVSAIVALVFSGKRAEQLSLINARKELDLLSTPFNELKDLNFLKLIKP